jgi:hypothetical protein
MDDTQLPHGTSLPEEDPVVPPSPDTFRRVVFGQVADPLVRPHPEAPEAEEDELTRAALMDSESAETEPSDEPTAWRWVVLLAGTALALYILFGPR